MAMQVWYDGKPSQYWHGLAKERYELAEQVEVMRGLLNAVTYSDWNGIRCMDIGGMNWFDAKDKALSTAVPGALREIQTDAARWQWLRENNDDRFVLWDRCSHELSLSPRPVLRLDEVVDEQMAAAKRKGD